jgi:probable rRNA maturation factor
MITNDRQRSTEKAIGNDRQRSTTIVKKVSQRQRHPQILDFDDHCRSLPIVVDRFLADRSIRVFNRQRRKAVDLKLLQQTAKQALALCFSFANAQQFPREIAVVLVSDRRMTDIHRRFMSINEPTDVITFQHGEIVVCVDSAERFGREYRRTTLEEIQLYVIHGLLHLAGFDDRTAKQAQQMRRLQERLFAQLRKQSELRV